MNTLLLFLLLSSDTTKPVFNPNGTYKIDSVHERKPIRQAACGTFVKSGNKKKNKRRNKREWGW